MTYSIIIYYNTSYKICFFILYTVFKGIRKIFQGIYLPII